MLHNLASGRHGTFGLAGRYVSGGAPWALMALKRWGYVSGDRPTESGLQALAAP